MISYLISNQMLHVAYCPLVIWLNEAKVPPILSHVHRILSFRTFQLALLLVRAFHSVWAWGHCTMQNYMLYFLFPVQLNLRLRHYRKLTFMFQVVLYMHLITILCGIYLLLLGEWLEQIVCIMQFIYTRASFCGHLANGMESSLHTKWVWLCLIKCAIKLVDLHKSQCMSDFAQWQFCDPKCCDLEKAIYLPVTVNQQILACYYIWRIWRIACFR